ncbi:tryptophan biosynthesis modulator TrpM [Streptomyces sp. NBRC 109706]|uniref:tryptophan biosynthesis modulator TrpM n=1 Tax=Streptomyces sp. NBRC 109706 TaxID=1550035 RepID=UPI00099C4B71|nr:hypothetical protein [Streptomyces sp. NBRC 109706]
MVSGHPYGTPRRGTPPPAGGIAARGARGARPRGCRAPGRRVLGRRVRYHIGAEPGQVRGRRWPAAPGPGAFRLG